MFADYHVHTAFSDDSIYPMEQVVQDAIMGLRWIGIVERKLCTEMENLEQIAIIHYT